MNLLSHLKLRTKLGLLVGLFTLVVCIAGGVGVVLLYQRMVNDRVEKLRAVVHTAMSLAQSLDARVVAHQLTRDQAQGQLRGIIHSMRFDDGAGYIFVLAEDATVMAHGSDPGLEGKPLPATDANGRLITDLVNDALRDSDETVISHMYPRPGQTARQPKTAYVVRFAPWKATFVAGAYMDDLNAEFRAGWIKAGWMGGAVLAGILAIAWLISRDITSSLGGLMAAMQRLAKGELLTAIPGGDRRDEVGGMARAVAVFQRNMIEAERLAAEQSRQRDRATAEKHAALVTMADAIETETEGALRHVSTRTAAMIATAEEMNASANRTGGSAREAATASALALATAQTVAAAAEQLSTSIREIGGQVSQSTLVVGRAVQAGGETRATIEALNEQVGRIGEVADMISEIAAKTNLLALNATIEAARAGDAGRGFAVVASEVKALAVQTAHSTQEIARHIAEVRSATGLSVAAVARIEQTIEEINAIAGSIAAAVEQQGAATAEIARNVTETASAANEMTNRTTEVLGEAARTGKQATEVREDATALNVAVESLRRAVIHVVRTSSPDVDRRGTRRRPCLADAAITCQGQAGKAVVRDISERGCFAETAMICPSGQRIEIVLDRFGMRLPGSVINSADGGIHVAFSGEGLAAGDADRVSLETIPDLVRLTKADHLTFVQKVVDAVEAREKLAPNSLATSHRCRLGRWYDGVSDPATMALASYKAIDAPHRTVHEAGHHALASLMGDDMATARRQVAEMREASARVLRCLDTFGQEYPGTVEASRRDVPATSGTRVAA